MRNKNFIIGVVFIVFVILAIIVGVFLFNPDNTEVAPEVGDAFGDTSTERAGALDENGVFGSIDDLLAMDEATAEEVPLLRLLSKERVIGAQAYGVLGADGTTTDEYVRFVERATGHILDTPLTVISEPILVSQKTMLRTGDVIWAPTAQSLLLRRLNENADTVFSYLGTLSPGAVADASTSLLTGRPLPNNLITAAFSPDGQSVFYIVPTEQGTTGYIERVATGERSTVWSSALKNLTAQWGGKRVLVHTNPSSLGVGAVWSIDADTHETTVILGKQTALEVNIHQNGSNILYSYLEPGSGVPALRAFDINTSNLVYLPMATLAEKCAWSTEGTRYVYCAIPRQQAREGFIEEWYQGKLTSDDVLWRFDLSTGEAKQLIDLYEELKVRLDVIDPVVSTHDNYLVFRSLRNDYLWALRLPSEDQPAMAESSPTE